MPTPHGHTHHPSPRSHRALSRRRAATWLGWVAGVVLLTLTPTSCSDSGGSIQTNLTLFSAFQNQPMTAGMPTQFQFTAPVPTAGMAFNRVTLNLTALASTTTLVLPKPQAKGGSGLGASDGTPPAMTARVDLRVSEPNDPNVCTTGEAYGPFTLTWPTSTSTPSVDPPTVTARPPTLNVLNRGNYSACITVTPNFTGTVGATQVGVDVDTCTQDATEIGGTWSGTFNCTNVGCPNDVNQPISLTILQDVASPHSATFTDGTASFSGTVCGDVFTFEGSADDGSYNEGGTFTVQADGTATKHVTFEEVDLSCRGTCDDVLMRN